MHVVSFLLHFHIASAFILSRSFRPHIHRIKLLTMDNKNSNDKKNSAVISDNKNIENNKNMTRMPDDVWSRRLDAQDPSSSVHTFSRPPILEALSLLPVAYRVGSYIYGERRNGKIVHLYLSSFCCSFMIKKVNKSNSSSERVWLESCFIFLVFYV